MPPENRGGKRSGNIGTLRPNRGDLRKPTSMVPQGQTYGQAGQQQARLKAAPIGGPRGKQQLPQGRVPTDDLRGKIPSVSDPTARPQEPVTAGLPLGPGPGPEALATASAGPMELSVLRAVFLLNPNEDLRRLIEWNERNL